jgi:hypothetical protein
VAGASAQVYPQVAAEQRGEARMGWINICNHVHFLCLDEEEEWLEPRPKSILKKRQGSTDDELEDRPKSILKSRLSPPPLRSRHRGECLF